MNPGDVIDVNEIRPGDLVKVGTWHETVEAGLSQGDIVEVEDARATGFGNFIKIKGYEGNNYSQMPGWFGFACFTFWQSPVAQEEIDAVLASIADSARRN